MALKAGRVGVYPSDLDKEGHIKQDASYTLPVANASTLGGVKPVAKTEGMSKDVGVDSEGKLYTSPDASYTLPVADASTLGGVKPVAKTSGMTQDVGVDSEGKLYVAPPSVAGGKIYYKQYDTVYQSAGYYATSVDIKISGYTPISAVALDVLTGYYAIAGVKVQNSGWHEAYVYPLTEGSKSQTFKVIVYYAKNSDLEAIS